MENFIKFGSNIVLEKGIICYIKITEDNGNKARVWARITKVFPADASYRALYLLKSVVGTRRYACYLKEIEFIQKEES